MKQQNETTQTPKERADEVLELVREFENATISASHDLATPGDRRDAAAARADLVRAIRALARDYSAHDQPAGSPVRPYGETVAPGGPWRVVHYGSPPQKGDSIFDADGCIAYFGDQHHEAVSRIVYEHNVKVAVPSSELDPSKLTSEELWRLADRMGAELVKRGELRRRTPGLSS